VISLGYAVVQDCCFGAGFAFLVPQEAAAAAVLMTLHNNKMRAATKANSLKT